MRTDPGRGFSVESRDERGSSTGYRLFGVNDRSEFCSGADAFRPGFSGSAPVLFR